MAEAFMDLPSSHLRRDVFTSKVIIATHMHTNKAPMNEPKSVCFSSIELKNEAVLAGVVFSN